MLTKEELNHIIHSTEIESDCTKVTAIVKDGTVRYIYSMPEYDKLLPTHLSQAVVDVLDSEAANSLAAAITQTDPSYRIVEGFLINGSLYTKFE